MPLASEASMNERRARHGYSLIEVMFVVGLIGVMAAMAMPRLGQMQANGRLRSQVREVASLLQVARQRAMTTGNNHVVYLSSDVGLQDLCTNPLPVDTAGRVYPVVMIDDGDPMDAGSNCCIDPGEVVRAVEVQDGLRWGVRAGLPRVNPQDAGSGNHNNGNTFALPGGGQAHAVLFRPDGIPVSVAAGCFAGDVGSGSGGIYITNNDPAQTVGRSYSIVLTPLGAVKIYGWEETANAGVGGWTN
jgi:prepilin-type N-terminal cleavage/methylation domain-containing protein